MVGPRLTDLSIENLKRLFTEETSEAAEPEREKVEIFPSQFTAPVVAERSWEPEAMGDDAGGKEPPDYTETAAPAVGRKLRRVLRLVRKFDVDPRRAPKDRRGALYHHHRRRGQHASPKAVVAECMTSTHLPLLQTLK